MGLGIPVDCTLGVHQIERSPEIKKSILDHKGAPVPFRGAGEA